MLEASAAFAHGEGELSLHDRILLGIAHPAWLREGKLTDNRWFIQTEDADGKRDAGEWIDFDIVIAPGLRLSHPDAELDRITAKLLVVYGLAASDGPFRVAGNIPIMLRNYYQFVRWRLSRGLPRNADLTPEWLDELFLTIRDRGIVGLLPLERRCADLVSAVAKGSLALPTWRKGRRTFKTYMAADQAAQFLGVDHWSQLTENVRARLAQLAQRQGLDIPDNQLKFLDIEVDAEPSEDEVQEEDLADGVLSWNRVATFLKSIDLLYILRHRLGHDPIPFAPFEGERTANSVAKAISSSRDGRTMTVPSYQACYLIDKALSWVLDYAPDLQRYVDHLEATVDLEKTLQHWRPLELALRTVNKSFVPEKGLGVSGSPWPLADNYWPGRDYVDNHAKVRPPLRVALYEFLAVACMIVIAAFSARRREEIESLRDGCIHFEDGEPWLETWIEKTIRDLDRIPIPFAVVRAIEVLHWLSRTHREATGRPWLFEFGDPSALLEHGLVDRSPRFQVYRSLARFAAFVDVPVLPDGSSWAPRPHQFRRFFGVTYYHHYRHAHLTALSNFYRHFDPDMTRRYVTEAVRGGFLRRAQENLVVETREARRKRLIDEQRLVDFDEEARAFRHERYVNVALGRERLSGHGGEKIAAQLGRLVSDIETRLEIGRDDPEFGPTLDQLIAPVVESTRLEPNSLGHSYCKCTTDPVDLRQAACLGARERTEADGPTFSAPDPAYAADLTCSGCAHNMQFDENQAYWAEAEVHEERQSTCAFSPLLRALAKKRLAGIQEHKARCFS